MSRFYCILFPAVVIFGSIGTALLKQFGLLDYAFFVGWTPGLELYGLAVLYCLTFGGALLLFRRTFALADGAQTTAARAPIIVPNQIAVVVIVACCLYALLYLWFDADLLTARVSVRHSGNEQLRRISLTIFLIGIFVTSTKPTLARAIPLLFLLFAATLYPSADAGRTAAIPFLVAAATMFYNRHFIVSGLMGLVSVIALATAFETRDLPSYQNFWTTFLTILVSFDLSRVIKPALQYSFPGLDTMSITLLYAQHRGLSAAFDQLFEFLSYYSPLPSGFFQQSFFDQLSLNGILGISRDVVGLNPDIYSESLFWFGYAGVVVVPFVLAFMTCLSFWSAKSIFGVSSRRSQLVGAIPVIWMLVGGMVFSLRAGSRFVWAIFIAALLLRFARTVRGRRAQDPSVD